MKKNIRHILYTSMALGVTLTTAVMLEGSANADTTTEPNQAQQTVQAAQPTTASANTATNDKQQSTNTDALDQAEAQNKHNINNAMTRFTKKYEKQIKLLMECLLFQQISLATSPKSQLNNSHQL